MIDNNVARFGDQKVVDEWEMVHAKHLARQRGQCDFCIKQRDIEQKNGHKAKATPSENNARRKAHDEAMAALEEHWQSGECKDQKEMGAGWIFDDYKPFNPDDPVMVKVFYII
jgi:hypothetical protein